jgi:hypothetical protein
MRCSAPGLTVGRFGRAAATSPALWLKLATNSRRAIARAATAAISAGSGGPSMVLIRMLSSVTVGTDRVVLSQRFQVGCPSF